MPKIFALTCNLLAETTLYFSGARLGRTQRALRSRFRVGGKGVNVAQFLADFSFEIFNVVFAGGEVGNRCVNFLNKNRKIKTLSVPICGETREGFVIRDTLNSGESTFLGCDAPLSDADFAEALRAISRCASGGDILALCGSVPGWSAAKFEALKNLLASFQMRLAVDTYGPPLLDLVKLNSRILKINADEFLGLAPYLSLSSEVSRSNLPGLFREAGSKIKAEFFAVSDGARPAMLALGGKFYEVRPPKLDCPAYPTGCGDRLFAELLRALAEKDSCGFGDFERAVELASEFAKIED